MNRRAAFAALAGAAAAAMLIGRPPQARAQARELPPDPPVAPRKPKTVPRRPPAAPARHPRAHRRKTRKSAAGKDR